MAMKPGRSKSTKMPKSRTRKVVIIVAAVVAVLIVAALLVQWHIRAIAASRKNHPAPVSTSEAVHTPAEAVDAAKTLYQDYLPLKSEVVARVGSNPLAEPALVQALRASKVGFSSDFYYTMLSDYMKEYQSSGKVTKDEVVCVSNATATDSVVLASSDGHDAIINVTLKLADGSTLLVPVTFDQSTLTAIKIACP
jgi:hypothetical protein